MRNVFCIFHHMLCFVTLILCGRLIHMTFACKARSTFDVTFGPNFSHFNRGREIAHSGLQIVQIHTYIFQFIQIESEEKNETS